MAKKTQKTAQTPGEKVRETMKEHHYTQAQLAEALDCSENHISMIVRGQRNLTVKNAKKIAQLFDVRFEWLLGFDECKTVKDRIALSMQSGQRKDDLIIEIMALHNFHLEDVTKTTKILTDSKGREYQRTTFELTSPRGSKAYMSPKELNAMLSSIDDYIDYQCAKRFKRTIDGVKNQYDWSV